MNYCDPHRNLALAAGHDGEHEDYIQELMEIYEADAYEEFRGDLILYKNGEIITVMEKK